MACWATRNSLPSCGWDLLVFNLCRPFLSHFWFQDRLHRGFKVSKYKVVDNENLNNIDSEDSFGLSNLMKSRACRKLVNNITRLYSSWVMSSLPFSSKYLFFHVINCRLSREVHLSFSLEYIEIDPWCVFLFTHFEFIVLSFCHVLSFFMFFLIKKKLSYKTDNRVFS